MTLLPGAVPVERAPGTDRTADGGRDERAAAEPRERDPRPVRRRRRGRPAACSGWSPRRLCRRCCWTTSPTKPTTLVGFLLLGVVLGFRLPAARPPGRAVGRSPCSAARGHALASVLEPAAALGRRALPRRLARRAADRPDGAVVGPGAARRWPLALIAGGAAPRRAASLLGAARLRAGVRQPGRPPLRVASSLTSLQTRDRHGRSRPSRSRWPAPSPCCCTGPTCRSAGRCGPTGPPASCCGGTSAGRWSVPPFVGWLVVRASDAGWFDPAYGQGLLVARPHRRHGGARSCSAPGPPRAGEHARTAVEDRERLQFLLDGTPVGIFETDADGRRRYVNRRWRELTGLSRPTAADSETGPRCCTRTTWTGSPPSGRPPLADGSRVRRPLPLPAPRRHRSAGSTPPPPRSAPPTAP